MKQLNTHIAFIGLGNMGSVLAKKLIQTHFNVTVYNRTFSKTQKLVNIGAKAADSLEKAVENSDVVITSLFDDASVLECTHEFLNTLKPGTIHIDTTTILPNTSKILTSLHKAHGTIYLAANILGVPKVAEQGELTTFVAGDKKAIEKCTPIFNSYASKIVNYGDDPYKANVMKICTNYMLATAIESMGEIYLFAEKNKVDADVISEMFHNIFAHPAFKLYIDKIKARNFDEVNFALNVGLKDLSLFQQAFNDELIVPDIANIIKNKLLIAKACGMEHKDWSAMTEVTRMLANGMDDKNKVEPN